MKNNQGVLFVFMKPYNNSKTIPKNTRLTPKKKVVGKRKKRPGMFSNDRTGKKELLVPVGNTAPWTTNVAPTGSGVTSSANKKRSAKKPKKTRKTKPVPVVRNKAPRSRTPNLGNQVSGGMWKSMG